MESLIRFTIRQRVLFNLLFVVLIAAGAFAISGLPVERYPDIDFGKVQVTTFYPGASPSDVEALVTRELEQALDGLQQVEFIRSSSVRDRSTLLVKFRDGADYDRIYDELRFRIMGSLDELPDVVDPPEFTRFRVSNWLPVLAVNLVGDRSNRALTIMAKELQILLAAIPGVDKAELMGEMQREFHIYLDPARMEAYGVTLEQVAAALTDANITIPAGNFTDALGELVVSVDERFRDRESVVSTVVRRDSDGSFVTLEDLISDAEMGYRDPHVITTINGRDCITIKLIKSEEGNALDIFDQAQSILAEQAPALAKQGVELVLTQDSTSYIHESISTLGSNLLVGVVLVSLIIWAFMGMRNAGLVTIGIPFSFTVTMVLLQLTGGSLNEITLFSFVLVSGIIVDDAVVVVENIYRRVQGGEPAEQAIVSGTAQVAWPVISSTATTVAAFMPMLIMTGTTGEFFAEIPKAVSFALLASVFECLLILPIHYLDYGPRAQHGGLPPSERDNRVMRTMRSFTNRLVALILKRRLTSLAVVFALFLSSLAMLGVSVAGIFPFIRIQFFPDDYKLYYVFIEAPAETSIETVNERVRAVSRTIIADGPGYAASAAGFSGFVVNEDYDQELGHNLGTIIVALPQQDQRKIDDPVAHLERMRERLSKEFAEPGWTIRLRAEKDGPPTGKDINIQVVGSDQQSVLDLTATLREALRNYPEIGPALIDLDDNSGQPARVLRLEVDEPRARQLGLTKGQAARMAAAVLDGRYIGRFRFDDEEVDLKLKIDPEFLAGPEAALDLPVMEHASGPVLLGDIVKPIAEIQPGELKRYQRQRSLTLTANLKPDSGVSSAQVVELARRLYQEIRGNYLGATLVFGGEYETTQRSFDSLTQAFGIAVLIIYLILAAQFRSYIQPLIVISAIVFAIIGVVYGKLITQSLFTVNSFIAVVGVTGVVVNDSLVLLDFINRDYRSGATRRLAVLHGIHVRLRPIVLTTLTTMLGLLPMALGIPRYSLIWGTMASTFVTGLATATLLTLFIVPVAWDLITEHEEKRVAKRLRRRYGSDGAEKKMKKKSSPQVNAKKRE